MLTIHHLEESRSQRIVWLAEELGIDYELIAYKRDEKTQLAPKALSNLHSLGKAPVIEHNGRVWAESALIISYMIDTFAKPHKAILKPEAGTDAYWQYQYWLHFAEGSFMANSFAQLLFKKITEEPIPLLFRPVTKIVSHAINDRILHPNQVKMTEYIESHLDNNNWFAGDEFTGADIQMSFVALIIAERGKLDCTNTQQFIERIRTRPAFIRAEAKGATFCLPDI